MACCLHGTQQLTEPMLKFLQLHLDKKLHHWSLIEIHFFTMYAS